MSRITLFGLESHTADSRPSFDLMSDLSEVVAEGVSIEHKLYDLTDAIVQSGHLAEATAVMATALESGERLSPYALEQFVILRDNVYKNLGIDTETHPSYLTVAEEGMSYRSALSLSLEEEKEVKKSIWAKIKEFFANLWKNITTFFKKLFGLQVEVEKEIKKADKILNEYDSAINSWDQDKLNKEYNKLLKSNIFSVGFYSGEYEKAKSLFKLPDSMSDEVKFNSELKWKVRDLTKINFKNKPSAEGEKLCYVNVELDEDSKKEKDDNNKADRGDVRAFLKFMRTQIGNSLDFLTTNTNKNVETEVSDKVKKAMEHAEKMSFAEHKHNANTKGEEQVRLDSLSGESYFISKENSDYYSPEEYKKEINAKVITAITNGRISMKLAKEFLAVLKKSHILTREDYETRISGFKAIQENMI